MASTEAGRRRQLVALSALSVAATLLVGLATNAASADATWPGWLRPIQDNPWVAILLVGVVAVGISTLLVSLPAPPPPVTAAGDQPQTPVAVLRSLPRDTTTFTNRSTDLARLTSVVGDRSLQPGSSLPVQAINGMAGVGKTTFVVHVAHLLSSQFPDGQVFINLDGHTPGRPPIRAQDALASLLLQLGVPPQRIPDDATGLDAVPARSALWRSLLVDKRMLLVFDNVAGYEQVEPLIPGSPGCLVLVTSRRRIVELEDTNVTMEVLSLDDAMALFSNLAQRRPDELDGDQVRQLVEISGRLPLAVSLLGARFRIHTSWSLSDLLARLTDEHKRLREMQSGERAVAAAFDLSYAQLPADRQRFFLHLGVFPGLTIDVGVAAALAGSTPGQAEEHLAALYDESIIEEMSSGSYRFHDLLRRYARDRSNQLTATEREAAASRLYAFYVEQVTRADMATARVAAGPTTPGSRAEALAWLERERVNILACLDRAQEDGRHDVVVGLSQGMAAFLQHAGPWDQAEHVQLVGLTSARAQGDGRGEAQVLTNLGILNRLMSRYDAARTYLSQAAELFGTAGAAERQAFALNHLGIVLYLLADYSEAEVAQERSLEAATAADDAQRRADALHDLGMIFGETARFDESEEAQAAALAIFQTLDDAYGQANALRSLGVVNFVQGKYAAALARQTEALALYTGLGDRLHVAYALNERGSVLRTVGDTAEAEQAHEQALEIYRDVGDSFGEANSLRGLSLVARRRQDLGQAVGLLNQALRIYGDLGSRGSLAATQRELGGTLGRMGRTSEALALLAVAHGAQVDLRDRLGQAETLNTWGEVLLDPGHRQAALERFATALALVEGLGCPLEEARALEGAGVCLLLAGQADKADGSLHRSYERYVEIGLPEDAERVSRLLRHPDSP